MQEPNPLLIFGLCVAGAGALVFLLWLNHQWATRGTRKREAATEERRQWSALEIAVSYILGGAGPVNDYDDAVLSYEQESARTERTNERTNEGSPHDQLWGDFLLDRTRTRLIAVMVDSDLTVSEIRNLLKGTSETVGEEIEAERKRQGKPPSHPYRTPIAGRPTDPAKFHDEPELEYKPLT